MYIVVGDRYSSEKKLHVYTCMYRRVVVNSDLWQLFSFAGKEDGSGLREGEHVRRGATTCAVCIIIISCLARATMDMHVWGREESCYDGAREVSSFY